MDEKTKSLPNKASFKVAIKKGVLEFEFAVPVHWLRWILIFLAAISATAGYPKLLEFIEQLLNITK